MSILEEYRIRTGLPVWQAEMEIDYSISDQVDFARWYTMEAIGRGVPVAWNSDTKFFDRLSCSWIEEMGPILDEIVG